MTLPPMTDVVSKNLKAIGYDGKTLVVAFRSGGVYAYEGVPPEVYAESILAPSPNQWFREKIKGRYRYEKVNEDAQPNPL